MEILQKILALIGLSGSKLPGGGKQGTEVTQLAPDLLMVTSHNYRYNRDNYRALLTYSTIQAAIILVLIGIAGWIIITADPQDRFFVASVDGRISRVMPLDTPTATNSDMYSRVGTAVAAALTFGFLDFEQRRVEVSPSFEPEALAALYKAFLGENGEADLAKNTYVYVAAVEPSRPGGVIQQGVTGNIYEWVISVPLLVTRKVGLSEEGQTVTRWNVRVLVQRAKALEVTRGFIVTRLLGAAPQGQPQSASPTVQGVTP